MDKLSIDTSFRRSPDQSFQLRTKSALIDRTFITDFNKVEINYQDKISEYYFQLMKQVNKLDSNIEEALRQHQQDYLKAFRCQMHKICVQLQQLRQKTDQNEMKLKRDQLVNKLQHSLNWFRGEAVKLGQTSQYYKKEADKWKVKAENLQDDRKFLQTQLKNAKIQIKEILNKQNKTNISDSQKSVSKIGNLKRVQSYVPKSTQGVFIFDSLNRHSFNTDFLTQIEKFMTKQEHQYNQSIKHLKNQLQNQKKKQKVISNQTSAAFIEKNQLQTIFLECIQEVRKDVMRRRAKTLLQQKYAKRIQPAYQKSQNFTAADKRKILELLVSNQQILLILYEKLFPQKASQFRIPNQSLPDSGLDQTPILDVEELVSQVQTRGVRKLQRLPSRRGSQ